MVDVVLTTEVVAALGDWTQRQVRNAVFEAVESLRSRDFEGWVRPWDLPALRRGAADLGEVQTARAVNLDVESLVAELLPSGRHVALRRTDHGWRVARFVAPGVTTLPPETTRRVPLVGSGPNAVLAALGVTRPDDVQMRYVTTELGQGETEYRHGYEWTDGTRTVLAEEVKNEIFDGATPYSRYVRGIVVDGDHGVILSGSGEDALLIEG
jgi:hypothetical protein